jgi:peptidoglycan/xylan/chitin deacetylase (PgdA/CDA1 family)
VAAVVGLPRGARAEDGTPRQVAITIDDFEITDHPRLSGDERHRAILGALEAHGIRAAGFPCGKRVDSPEQRARLVEWCRRGHPLGNHTYSHAALSNVELAAYQGDVIRGEAVVRDLPTFTKFLRFPYLDEGRTAAKRDGMRKFLDEIVYRNAHVTIDTSDWYVDQRLRARLSAEPDADIIAYRDFYLEHVLGRAEYYDGLAREVLGHTIPHTLLLHHNLLNGLFLNDLLARFGTEGWQLIDASVAYGDPVFAKRPDTLPAGQSLVWALAKETGRFDDVLRYPGENDTYEKPRMDELGL